MTAALQRSLTVLDDETARAADRYARALLEALPDDARAEAAADELEAVVALLGRLDGAEDLLACSLIGKQERLVQRVFGGRVSEPVEAFLHALARRGRLGLLRAATGRFRGSLHRRQGKVEATVVTAVELDAPVRQRVAAALSETLAAPVVLKTEVEESLLGGLLVRVGERVYDASIGGELRRLKDSLSRRVRETGSAPRGGTSE